MHSRFLEISNFHLVLPVKWKHPIVLEWENIPTQDLAHYLSAHCNASQIQRWKRYFIERYSTTVCSLQMNQVETNNIPATANCLDDIKRVKKRRLLDLSILPLAADEEGSGASACCESLLALRYSPDNWVYITADVHKAVMGLLGEEANNFFQLLCVYQGWTQNLEDPLRPLLRILCR